MGSYDGSWSGFGKMVSNPARGMEDRGPSRNKGNGAGDLSNRERSVVGGREIRRIKVRKGEVEYCFISLVFLEGFQGILLDRPTV